MRKFAHNVGLAALLFVPMLAACGQENSGGGGDFVTVPSCGQNGQVLSTDSSGQLICKDLPAGTISLPNCKPGIEALTGDGKTVFCTDRNNESAAARSALEQLNKLEMDITEYNMKITLLSGMGGAARPRYIGTAGMVNGQITMGNATGAAGAAAICAQTHGMGAQMCTVYDMYYSVQSGAITDTTMLNNAWVYMTSWKQPRTGAQEPLQGMNDNCATYTYPTGDLAWTGTTVAWANTSLGNKALKFTSGQACNVARPIACCK